MNSSRYVELAPCLWTWHYHVCYIKADSAIRGSDQSPPRIHWTNHQWPSLDCRLDWADAIKLAAKWEEWVNSQLISVECTNFTCFVYMVLSTEEVSVLCTCNKECHSTHKDATSQLCWLNIDTRYLTFGLNWSYGCKCYSAAIILSFFLQNIFA